MGDTVNEGQIAKKPVFQRTLAGIDNDIEAAILENSPGIGKVRIVLACDQEGPLKTEERRWIQSFCPKNIGHREVKTMSKLILASNLPRVGRPMQVVGAHMQRFCNCKVNPRANEGAETKKVT